MKIPSFPGEIILSIRRGGRRRLKKVSLVFEQRPIVSQSGKSQPLEAVFGY